MILSSMDDAAQGASVALLSSANTWVIEEAERPRPSPDLSVRQRPSSATELGAGRHRTAAAAAQAGVTRSEHGGGSDRHA